MSIHLVHRGLAKKNLKEKFISTYNYLSKDAPKILLTSYFSSAYPNYNLLKKINVDGIHFDLVNTEDKDLNKTKDYSIIIYY